MDLWFTNCPEEGLELYENEEAARKAAESILAAYSEAASSDGWHESMEDVCWGKLDIRQAAVITERTLPPEGYRQDYDEWLEYGLGVPGTGL